MSYFDDASLVFIPSGTKVSKAYSVKPIDGTGDLTLYALLTFVPLGINTKLASSK